MKKTSPETHLDFYQVLNKSEGKEVDILIYGAIPELDWDTYELKNVAQKFVQEFKKLEKEYDRINVHINSPGGSLYHAFPIYNVIRQSKADVHTYNDGLAASAGGILLLAGKTIHSAKNAFLMVHRASGAAYGTAEKLRDTANMLEKYEAVVAERFAEKTGMSVKDFTAKYFNGKDHFLDSSEAMEGNFIDIVEDYESEDAPPSDIKNMAFGEIMNFYKKEDKSLTLFEKITNHIRNTFADQATKIPTITITNAPNHNNDMTFENLIEILNKAEVTQDELANVKASLEAFNASPEKLTAEEVTARIAEATGPLSTEITNLATEKANAEALLTAVKNEKDALATEKTSMETELNSVKLTLEAYRKSGVQVDNTKDSKPDQILGEEKEDDFTSEADLEMRAMRNQAGFQKK